MQTGRGLSALHTKAVELLDGKGKPVKERGVVKLVHVPLSPVQVLMRTSTLCAQMDPHIYMRPVCAHAT